MELNHQTGGNSPPVTPKRKRPGRHRSVKTGMTDEQILEKELRIVNSIVDYPKVWIGSCFIIFLVLTIIGFVVVGIKISNQEMADRNDWRTERRDSVHKMRETIEEQPNGINEPDTPRELIRTEELSSYYFIYNNDNDDVFTLANAQFMKETEDRLLNDPEFSNQCLVQWFPSTATCPGKDCPWYRTNWDYTKDAPMVGGSKMICSPPTSLAYLFYNTRLAVNVPVLQSNGDTFYAECDLASNYAWCVANGISVYLSQLVNGKTAAQNAEDMEKGGVEPTQQQINAYVAYAARARNETMWLNIFFDKTYGMAPKPETCKATRTKIDFGGPRERINPSTYQSTKCQQQSTQVTCEGVEGCGWTVYAGITMNSTGCQPMQYNYVSALLEGDTNEDQVGDFSKWAKDFTSYFEGRSGPDTDLYFFASGVLFDRFLEILARDALLAVLSFVFVYLYLQIHTGSFFLASLGMIQVIMPFSMGYFVYRVVFQIKGFYGLSSLALYIVLAIGADDIFVFMDNWAQAGVRPRPDNCTYVRGRMSHAWKIAGTAMGITSLTTMAAFIATMTTPLLEIKLFGLFAAILVFFDYLLVMTFFAAAVVIYHRSYEHTIGCCCCGNTLAGAWCNCCTCYSTLLNGDENTVITHVAPDDGSRGSSSSNGKNNGEFVVPERPKIECMETLLVEPRTFESIEEAREKLGTTLNREQTAQHETASVSSDYKEKLHEAVASDPTYKISRIVGLILLVMALVMYITGFSILQSDHTTGYSRVFLYSTIIIIGLLLFDAAMNALAAARDRRVEIEGHSSASSNFMVAHVAPFLSGTGGIGKYWYVRIIPGIILVGVWIVLVIHAFKLDYTSKSEQWLPDWHPLQKYMDSSRDDFVATDTDFVQSVQVVFGTNVHDPIDRSGTDKYASGDRGKAVYSQWMSKQSDLSSEEFQQFTLGLCDHILETSATNGALLQRRMVDALPDPRKGLGDQNCIMRGLKEHVEGSGGVFPVVQANFLTTLWDFMKTQSTNKLKLAPHQRFYDKVLFKFENGNDKDPTGIETVMLEFNTTLKQFGNAYSDITKWFGAWEDYMDGVKAMQYPYSRSNPTAAAAWSGRILHSSEMWVRMRTQYLLVSGAIMGTLVSLGLATFIIFLASFNVLIALFVLLELCGVVGCTLGMTYLLGWELGMVESVSITILVGLSVDYVVHFAVHYGHVQVHTANGEGPTERQRRVHEVVSDMGPTVLGGAATSIGASLILVCTWVQFFYKFGVIFLFTILFSYLWSMLFFLPLMSFFGPEREFLSMRPLLAKCAPKWFAKEDDEGTVDPEYEMKNRDEAEV